jgi:hypothetical protein
MQHHSTRKDHPCPRCATGLTKRHFSAASCPPLTPLSAGWRGTARTYNTTALATAGRLVKRQHPLWYQELRPCDTKQCVAGSKQKRVYLPIHRMVPAPSFHFSCPGADLWKENRRRWAVSMKETNCALATCLHWMSCVSCVERPQWCGDKTQIPVAIGVTLLRRTLCAQRFSAPISTIMSTFHPSRAIYGQLWPR